MSWTEWILIVGLVGVPFVLLCYSFFSTALEIGRKGQPLVDSLLESVYALFTRAKPSVPSKRISGKSKPD